MKSRIGKLIEALYKGIVHNFARLVFRELNGTSVASGTAHQPAAHSAANGKSKAFRHATAYAKKRSGDPAYRHKAELNRTSAYNVAMADYLSPPLIYNVDAGAYEGLPGTDILIEATDDFQVASVKVKIMDGSGTLVEEGEARQNGDYVWRYTTTATNKNFPDSIIAATAYDKPGNTGIYAIKEDGTEATLQTLNPEAS